MVGGAKVSPRRARGLLKTRRSPSQIRSATIGLTLASGDTRRSSAWRFSLDRVLLAASSCTKGSTKLSIYKAVLAAAFCVNAASMWLATTEQAYTAPHTTTAQTAAMTFDVRSRQCHQ